MPPSPGAVACALMAALSALRLAMQRRESSVDQLQELLGMPAASLQQAAGPGGGLASKHDEHRSLAQALTPGDLPTSCESDVVTGSSFTQLQEKLISTFDNPAFMDAASASRLMAPSAYSEHCYANEVTLSSPRCAVSELRLCINALSQVQIWQLDELRPPGHGSADIRNTSPCVQQSYPALEQPEPRGEAYDLPADSNVTQACRISSSMHAPAARLGIGDFPELDTSVQLLLEQQAAETNARDAVLAEHALQLQFLMTEHVWRCSAAGMNTTLGTLSCKHVRGACNQRI